MSTESESSNIDVVVVVSVTEKSPEYIIKKILGVEDLPSPSTCYSSIKGYEWKLDTKYYSANVTLYSVEEAIAFDADFCENIQATIFHFNGSEPTSFENVLNWMPSLKDITSDVQLLVCDNCGSDENHRKRILKWCVEKQFELVEMNPLKDSDDDEEEDDGLFSQAKGFGRVISALQAHTWSNLIMKEEVNNRNPIVNEKNDSASGDSAAATKSTDKKMTVDNEEVLLEEQWLQKVLEQDDPDGESFEALFSKFASMKERASGLNGEERKKYAEKVAIAFWKAMGGEEDEIAGLDDD